MHILKLFLAFIVLNTFVSAKSLSISNIQQNIKTYVQKSIKNKNNRYIINKIYSKNNYRPLWYGVRNNSKKSELINALTNPLYNYKNLTLNQSEIRNIIYILNNNKLLKSDAEYLHSKLDIILTNSLIRLIRFVVQGDVDWALVKKKLKNLKKEHDIKANWDIKTKKFPNINKLSLAIKSGNITKYLNSLLPMEQRYKALIRLLNKYKHLPEFSRVPYSGKTLKLGEYNYYIGDIKRRLKISGDYSKDGDENSEFTKELENAVLIYQKRYLLKQTGQVDARMIYYLNQPKSTLLQSIITNLDKTKIYPRNFNNEHNEHIEVNIPDYTMRYLKNNQTVLKKNVVVGRLDRPTALFSDKMEYMVINPKWTISHNLVRKDLFTVLQDEPNYMKENNIHVFHNNKEIYPTAKEVKQYIGNKKPIPYKFIQYPGKTNVLGRVKFMFPNKYTIYLHDTDDKSLFDYRYRIFSSGCMRVQKPMELVDILLPHTKRGYTKPKIDKLIENNETKTISLKDYIRVHILYFTVYEENSLAYFRNDIYMYDKIIEESIKGSSKKDFVLPENRMITVKQTSTLRF